MFFKFYFYSGVGPENILVVHSRLHFEKCKELFQVAGIDFRGHT